MSVQLFQSVGNGYLTLKGRTSVEAPDSDSLQAFREYDAFDPCVCESVFTYFFQVFRKNDRVQIRQRHHASFEITAIFGLFLFVEEGIVGDPVPFRFGLGEVEVFEPSFVAHFPQCVEVRFVQRSFYRQGIYLVCLLTDNLGQRTRLFRFCEEYAVVRVCSEA